jgi:hypothetical protein
MNHLVESLDQMHRHTIANLLTPFDVFLADSCHHPSRKDPDQSHWLFLFSMIPTHVLPYTSGNGFYEQVQQTSLRTKVVTHVLGIGTET